MSHAKLEQLPIINLGLTEYGEAWELQKNLHQALTCNGGEACVLVVEHPRVLTLGKHATRDHLLFAKEFYAQQGIAIYEIDRGGEVTAHEPGQLVVYPILPIDSLGLTPRKYVQILEQSVIETLASYHVAAHVDADYPGVWIENEKICAVGVRIKDRATMHGIGFNVCNDLKTFQAIVPCGIQQRGVTTLSKVLDRSVKVEEVARLFSEILATKLGTVAVMRDLPTFLPHAAKKPMISY